MRTPDRYHRHGTTIMTFMERNANNTERLREESSRWYRRRMRWGGRKLLLVARLLEDAADEANSRLRGYFGDAKLCTDRALLVSSALRLLPDGAYNHFEDPSVADGIRAIGLQIRTQDNACTADPIFLVQQTHRIYGISDDYAESYCWIDDDGEEVSSEELSERAGRHPSTWREVGYTDIRVFVQPFFTRVAAEAFIAANRHNLFDPTIYVDSGNRNPEWKTLRAILANGVTP